MGEFMVDTIKFIFGLIATIVATLILWTMFMGMQPQIYDVMRASLSVEWNRDTGNNGELINSYKNTVWENDDNVVFGVYNEG